MLLHRLQGGDATISGDVHRIATCYRGDIKIWDAATGQCIHTFEGHNYDHYVHISKDGKWLVSGGEDGEVILWSLDDGEHLKKLRGQSGQAGPICRVTKMKTFKGHRNVVARVVLSPDAAKVASVCDRNGNMVIWSTNTSKQLWACSRHDMECVAWSPDSKLVASGGYDGILRVWKC